MDFTMKNIDSVEPEQAELQSSEFGNSQARESCYCMVCTSSGGRPDTGADPGPRKLDSR